jgi:magnesium chelatase subunit I
VLVGSGNPEEGELRPQLLDRFGLSVEVRTPTDVSTWVEIVKRRDAFERDPPAFNAQWAKEEDAIRRRIVKARKHLNDVDVPDQILERAAALCINLKTDGLRGPLTLMRAARALAAYEGAKRVTNDHLKRMAGCSLRHRLRRNPLDETGSTTRINRAVAEVLGA